MAHITENELLELASRVGQMRGSAHAEVLADLFYRSYQLSQNYNYDLHSNGEARILQILNRFTMKTVFDVGANVGDWTKVALSILPESKIYAFEPIPETFQKYTATIGDEPRVCSFNEAVGSCNGEVNLRYYPKLPGQTSSFEFLGEEPFHQVVCKSTALDSFAKSNSIERVDLLKVDVEGAEHLVFDGAEELLQARRIRAIQFEYGQININTHFLLKDFYEFFAKRGYRVGKIYPKWVDFRSYAFTQENFIGPNFVAVCDTESEVIDALGRSE